MNKQFDVVVVGELNVDLILNDIEKFPEIGKEVLANNMTLTLGSSSAIFACNLSVLGSSVCFIGKTGNDNFATHVIDALNKKNIATGTIIRSNEHSTGATIVLNFSEDRANITYPGAMSHLSLADIDDNTLLASRHLHVSSVFLQAGLRKDIIALFRKAKEKGLTTSLDPQWDPAEQWDLDLNQLLPHVDLFLPNVAELQGLTGTGSLENALNFIKQFKGVTVVKNGRDGAWLWNGESLQHQPAFINDKVVDSIGAGDSFNAGFVNRFLEKKPLTECLAFGALTGAVNTTRHGGTGAFENIDLVKTIAQNTFNYTF